MSVRDPLASPVVPAPASPTVTAVASIAALKALAGTNITGTVEVLSRIASAIPDGLGGVYTWNSTDTRSDDSATLFTIIQPDSGGVGRWNQVTSGSFSQTPAATAGSVAAKLQQIISVKDAPYNAVGDGVTDDTAADQAALTANLNVSFPNGNYKLTSALSLVLYQQVLGAGRSDYLYNVAPSSSNVAGTRLIQTGSAAVFTMGSPASAANYAGRIKITDMVLQGVSNTTVNGTEGIKCIGSQSLTLERVQASFFLNAGFRLGACIDAIVANCYASYSQDAGLDLTYDADYVPSSYNAYNCLVLGGQYTQCKNANIRLGTSSFGVKIIGADIESAGSFYGGGTGYGVDVTGQAEACGIYNSWIEGNVLGINLGPTGGTSTVPHGFVIQGNQFGSVTGSYQIRLRSGRGTVIRDNHFPDGGLIYLDPYTDNPVVSGNKGLFKLTNASGETIPYNNLDPANDFPNPDISSWTKSNCAIAIDTTVISPGGVIPVYKVTPTASGLLDFNFIGTGISPYTAGKHHTFGFWIKSNSSTRRNIGWQLDTTGGPTVYSAYDSTDREVFADGWQWVSFGRSIPSTDTGNFRLDLISSDNAGTTVFWITAMQSKPGIINVPFPPLTNGVAIPRTGTSATDTIVASDSAFIANRAGTITLTLESAAANPGKQLTIRTIQAQTVVSAASNVVPLAGGAAGTAILAATAGKWAILQSDGANWQIQCAN